MRVSVSYYYKQSTDSGDITPDTSPTWEWVLVTIITLLFYRRLYRSVTYILRTLLGLRKHRVTVLLSKYDILSMQTSMHDTGHRILQTFVDKSVTAGHFSFFCIMYIVFYLCAQPRSLLLSTIDSVCPDVCPSVTLLQIASYFFVSRWNQAIFWPSVLHVALYKTMFLDFWFRHPNAQNLHKIAYKSACMADRHKYKQPCGYLLLDIIYGKICLFGSTRRFSGMADSMEPCKMLCGTLVAMATKFGLDAEIKSPTGLSFFCLSCCGFCILYFGIQNPARGQDRG